jgi:hypothetical protein
VGSFSLSGSNARLVFFSVRKNENENKRRSEPKTKSMADCSFLLCAREGKGSEERKESQRVNAKAQSDELKGQKTRRKHRVP